jgi:hypothetical protein
MRTTLIIIIFSLSLANISQAQWINTDYPMSVSILNDNLVHPSKNKIWGLSSGASFSYTIVVSNDGGYSWSSFANSAFKIYTYLNQLPTMLLLFLLISYTKQLTEVVLGTLPKLQIVLIQLVKTWLVL